MLIFLGAIALIFMYHWVLEGIAYQAMARRRGLRHRWLVWLPVGRDWVRGSLSDQYQYLVRGQICNKRKVLLGISLGMLLLWTLNTFVISRLAVQLQPMVQDVTLLQRYGEAFVRQNRPLLRISGMMDMLLRILLVVRMVFRTIALYDVYASCMPGSQTTYLVLSLIFPVTRPILLMSSRKKGLQYP